MSETKTWWKSKTLWVNIIAGAAFLIQAYYGFVIAPEEQAGLLVVVNLIMRAITKTGLENPLS